jgi:hypothetical protein
LVQRFARVSALFNYHKFFPILLKQAIDTLTTQNILVVELKHIAGRLFDDDLMPVSFERELEYI